MTDLTNQAKDLTQSLKHIREHAEDLKRSMRRYIQIRDEAVADLKVLVEATQDRFGASATVGKLQKKVDDAASAIDYHRKELMDLEVHEGRQRKAAKELLGEMLKEAEFYSNQR